MNRLLYMQIYKFFEIPHRFSINFPNNNVKKEAIYHKLLLFQIKLMRSLNPFLFDTGFFAGQFTQVIQFGSAYFTRFV